VWVTAPATTQEAAVAGRIFFTGIASLMAVGGFFGAGPTSGGILDPFGIFFVFMAILTWFAWGLICDGFATGPMDFMLVRAALLLKNKSKQNPPE
jgi:hypothetical protein